MSKIVLGTAQYGMPYGINNKAGMPSNKKISEILNYARAEQITYLDTAPGYGEAQTKLGLLAENRFHIITKFPYTINHAELKGSLTSSLHELKVKQLYGYLAHDPNCFIDNPGLWSTLRRLQVQNKIRKIGYSLYTVRQLKELLDLNFYPDIVQVPYSLLDRKFEDWFSILKELNTEVHVRSVFLQGLYFMNPSNLTEKTEALYSHLTSLIHLCDEFEISMNQLALNFVSGNPFIDKMVLGADSINQLSDNLKILNISPLSVELQARVRAIEVVDKSLLNPLSWV